MGHGTVTFICLAGIVVWNTSTTTSQDWIGLTALSCSYLWTLCFIGEHSTCCQLKGQCFAKIGKGQEKKQIVIDHFSGLIT
jgi:hypothetical protein